MDHRSAAEGCAARMGKRSTIQDSWKTLQRKQAEEASRETERILKQNENDLRGLAGRLIHNQEEERSRLARELHDDLVQRLAVFAIDIGKFEQQLKDQPAVLQEKLREMKSDIVKISEDVHNLSRRLHPSILDDLGLIKAIESECTNFSRREGIEVVFRHEDIPKGHSEGYFSLPIPNYPGGAEQYFQTCLCGTHFCFP